MKCATLKCATCGRSITNAYYINGIAYGYNCYKEKLALIYKQWEDERNLEYSSKCCAAIEIYSSKKSNSFHESIMKQWNDCKKLTAKQLDCIIKGFSVKEKINFYCVWFVLTKDKETIKALPTWLELAISSNSAWGDYIENEAVNSILNNKYLSGFHYLKDIEDEIVYICENGKCIGRNKETKERFYDDRFLQEHLKDEYMEVLKVIS